MEKQYKPKKIEEKIYLFWEKGGFFNPDKLPASPDERARRGGPGKRRKNYTIVIPPPNITGELHMGHALQDVVHDILVRQKRMQGYQVLWLPGTDHAGIATQNRVEKELKKKGKTRFDLGREKFIKRVWQWKEEYGNIILEQLKKMGCSCDWSRTRFTMDKDYVRAVEKAFLYYYKKGWIYRGKRVVNWCPRCQTSLSDLELEYKEKKGNLWFIKYRLLEEEDKYIIVATTRPETMLGDTALAINPKDKRYKDLIGKKVIVPIVDREIPVIADRIIDTEFGTGAVKVTPAHDSTDYEIGLRHNLKSVQVINENGKITENAPRLYQGLTVLEAREKVLIALENLGLLEKAEDYTHQIPKCYRCGATIELIPSWQWFLKMNNLAKLSIQAVKTGKVKFQPKRWEKPYLEWLRNIKDWCISRQIWWGHKIPLKGETDVLDTWFSSALWPFAALGWPKKTKDLKRFYPTDVLITDRGIINLWVTRMIFSGMEFMKKPPFRKVYIHATVLTKAGARMSKSLGTGIDPINLIEKYGADATRFGIVWQITDLQDIRFGEENIIMGRKFCNKLWNASRFVLQQISKPNNKSQSYWHLAKLGQFRAQNLTEADKKILKQLNRTIKSVNKDLDSFQFGQAAHKFYDFFWHDFCDKYIETSKKQTTPETQQVLTYVLFSSLKLLHPFMPFITEEIYQTLPLKEKKALIIEKWPG